MSSEFVVPVVVIENVRPHSNSDNLELCDVLGYQMCVPKGKHHDGDVMVYFPADTLIPYEWAEKFGVRKYLKGKDQDRVGRIRLRGEPSFGLVVPQIASPDWKVGDNVAWYFGAKKYEPPVRATAGDAAPRDPLIDPFFEQFTDVQNGRLFTDIFVDGEEVIYTEKIHGCFTADTPVMLSNGELRPISEISPKDYVLLYDERTKAFESRQVTRTLCQAPVETQKWMKLYFDNSQELVCTEDHLFLTQRGWVAAKDLNTDDDLVSVGYT
jgi:RNA ligase (TIGR02306 family)